MVEFLSSQSGLAFVAVAAVVLATVLTAVFRRVLLADTRRGSAKWSVRAGLPLATVAALLGAAAVVVPLVFAIASPDVFVLPKLTALRVTLVAGLVLLGLGASRLVEVGAPTTSRTTRAIDLALIAYAGLTTLATVASIDPGLSLVGQDVQYQGLFTTLLFVAFFYLARVSLRDQQRLSLLLVATTTGGAIVAGYAVIQQLHLDPIWSTLYKDRVFSTFGQAEWLGAYFVLCLALGSALLWHVRPLARFVVGSLLGLMLIGLLLTLSRGAYLGMGVAAAVFVFSLVPGARPTRRWLLALPALGFIAVLVSMVPPVRSEAETIVSRAVSTTDLSEGSIADRLDLWKVGAAIAIDHPILGTGPETYPLLFPQYRDSLLANRRDFWLAYRPENPHNMYLAIAAGAGIPALAAYLALIGALFVQLIGALKHAPSRAARVTLAAVLAAAAGHLVTDLFMPADIAGSWLFWLILGAGAGYAQTLLSSPGASRAARDGVEQIRQDAVA